ncbi:hypothetical protein V8E54_015197 [Elaphomyces granulatus]
MCFGRFSGSKCPEFYSPFLSLFNKCTTVSNNTKRCILGFPNIENLRENHDNALQSLYKKFPGLKRDLIKSIRHSKFIPRMLFKLRYAQGVNTDRRTQVLITDGKIEVVAKDYLKGYGRTSSIWTEGFVNYAAILVEFFGAEFHIGSCWT